MIIDPQVRIRDERDMLRRRIDAFARLLDAAEKAGAREIRIADVRTALKLPARQELHRG